MVADEATVWYLLGVNDVVDDDEDAVGINKLIDEEGDDDVLRYDTKGFGEFLFEKFQL